MPPGGLEVEALADLDEVQGRMVELFARVTAEQRAQYLQLLNEVNRAVEGPIDGIPPAPHSEFPSVLLHQPLWALFQRLRCVVRH